jgi:hypothetical protein
MAPVNKVFLLLFVHKKKSFLPFAPFCDAKRIFYSVMQQGCSPAARAALKG